jgi:hypothetical protein
MTTIFVCDDQRAKYNQGMCAKPNEQKRAQFSLWFAYAVDVVTDLAGLSFELAKYAPLLTYAVMFLPFSMTWNLRLPRSQKLGIFVLFGSGWICIVCTSETGGIFDQVYKTLTCYSVFATLRVVLANTTS